MICAPERLAALRLRNPRDGGEAGLAMAAFYDVRRESKSYSAIAAVVNRNMTITEGEEPERLDGAAISWDLFPMLGKAPQLGRSFRQDEDAGAPPTVVLLSDRLWRRRFNLRLRPSSGSFQVDSRPLTVIGVMPPRFRFPETAELWVPLGDLGRGDTRNARYVSAYARLREGVTHAEAEREFTSLVERLERDHGLAVQGWQGDLMDLRTEFVPKEIRLVTLAMFGAVTFVLLIAVANVANLTLARASSQLASSRSAVRWRGPRTHRQAARGRSCADGADCRGARCHWHDWACR
jgi:putative ABC transport system permease protein